MRGKTAGVGAADRLIIPQGGSLVNLQAIE